MIKELETYFLSNIDYYSGYDEYCNELNEYPEVIGKVLTGYSNSNTVDKNFLRSNVNKLISMKNDSFSQFSWGLPFVFGKCKSSYLVTTEICLNGIIKADKFLKECDLESIISSVFDWVYNVSGITDKDNAIFFNYSPAIMSVNIYNATAEFLWLLYEYESLLSSYQISRRDLILESLLSNQNNDGSWYYSDESTIIDFLHSCYVLEGLLKIKQNFINPRLDEAIKRGIDFVTNRFLRKKIIPENIYLNISDIRNHSLENIFFDILRNIKHFKIKSSRLWGIAAGIRMYSLANSSLNGTYNTELELLINKAKQYKLSNGFYRYTLTNDSIYIRHESHFYEAIKLYESYLGIKE